MIDLEAARGLLDFGSRIGDPHRAEEQLRGAVAIHNILEERRVAYLADEVGMGKTYVALGALALFRHYDPAFRVLVIAPRENIQNKWQKELRNFVAHNVRFDDLRVRSLDGRPARPLVSCRNLLELVRETSVDRDRDFFMRMTSFSLPLSKKDDDLRRTRDGLRAHLPWLPDEALSLRQPHDEFKRSFGRALCTALPEFDLVIVDEAHNLKHGYSTGGSSRNLVMGEAFGRSPLTRPEQRLFPGYGPRAKRVLLLSATPLEESYGHIWNQLDLFGLGEGFEALRDESLPDAEKKEVAARFLVRRVTALEIEGAKYTKNMYRREWRRGGVRQHDEPIRIEDDRQRLVVALVQKKVSELLRGKQFNNSFQIGMLASFESFLETAKLKRDDREEATFDDSTQSELAAEREGVDVHELNRLARNYRQRFGREMPHPKMDAVVDALASSWTSGKKALVFVRRVASVKELKRKLDERYDDWLIPHLRGRLPEALTAAFDEVVETYRREKAEADRRRTGDEEIVTKRHGKEDDENDKGGTETFFAWFFRGTGPAGVLSGAALQERFGSSGSAYSTFFEQNHVAELLECEPGCVLDSLAGALGISSAEVAAQVRARAAKYLTEAKTVIRARRLIVSQAAALELLRDSGVEPLSGRARVILEELFAGEVKRPDASEAPPEIARALETQSFFTELVRPEHAALRARIWPAPAQEAESLEEFRRELRERVMRAELLSAAARLGNAYIDLYVAALSGRTSLAAGRGAQQDGADEEGDVTAERLLREYLAALESQMGEGEPARWGALRELSEIAENFELILDVNLPETRELRLSEFSAHCSKLLRKQQPTGGMVGQVNHTLVKQFRMPGYPAVLVTTDVLQEGEDLHTFCSSVHHYGISWTPSAMEQRIGRVDRVRSQTERRLVALGREPEGDDWLQVYFPFLEDTVEVLQVERVLQRMNTFLRLMHENLTAPTTEQKRIDVHRELLGRRAPAAIVREPLVSAFPVREESTRGEVRELAVGPELSRPITERFEALPSALAHVAVEWSPSHPKGAILGSLRLESGRVQPFTLLLGSVDGRPLIRCISPVGRTNVEENAAALAERAARQSSRVGAILTKKQAEYDLTVEDDVLLGAPERDAARVTLLLTRVTEQADRMERAWFDDGRDEPIQSFEEELKKEAAREA